MSHTNSAPPSGHLFNLSDEQKKLLSTFQDSVRSEYEAYRKRIVENRVKYEAQIRAKHENSTETKMPTSPSSTGSFAPFALSAHVPLYTATPPFYADETPIELAVEWRAECLRFLRGRKWKLEDTKTRYLDFLKFREQKNLDFLVDFHELFVPWPRVDLIRKCCPNGPFGIAKNGSPIYWEKSGKCLIAPLIKHFPEADEVVFIHLVVQEEMTRVATVENRKRRAEALAAAGLTASAVTDAAAFPKYDHVETFYNILDLKGLNAGHRACLKYTKGLLEADEKMYPERMEKLYCINTPWIFPIIWNIVKPWIDPHTRSKIHVLKANFLPNLQKEISDENIPQDFGGSGVAPALNEQRMADLLKEAKNQNTEMDLTTEKVPAGAKVVKTLQGHPGALYGYYFETVKHDIEFSVEFVSDRNSEEKVVVVAPSRVGRDQTAQQGSYTAVDSGTIHFIFDNSFSWLTAKEVKYNFSVGNIDAEE